MKSSLALGTRRPLSPQTAWGCLTSNLAFPGSGSLVAVHASGYAQGALAVGGMIVTLAFGIPLMIWAVSNWSQLFGGQNDPVWALTELWTHMRWALLGIAIFGFGWLWALGTSIQIVRAAKRAADKEPVSPPPLS